MIVQFGDGKTSYGPGVSIELTGDEVALAISAFLVAHGIHIDGARTVSVNGELCETGQVYVDPSGFVVANGQKFSGRAPAEYQAARRWFLATHSAPVRLQRSELRLVTSP